MSSWLYAFVLTALIELPIVVAMTSGNMNRRLLVGFGAQLATHPLLWFYFARIPGITGRTGVFLGELFAVVAEAVIYRIAITKLSSLRAFGVSAVANGVSLAIGVLMQKL
jgi:hypothetical protein